jgi:hypothetical protein
LGVVQRYKLSAWGNGDRTDDLGVVQRYELSAWSNGDRTDDLGVVQRCKPSEPTTSAGCH